jgi:formylglycine-generating enzyme required for sulfatase activity
MAAVTLFMSYSRRDDDLVTRLRSDLGQAGAVIWIDDEQLTPGTGNWQLAIRDGIEAAETVVYIGSPDAARSQFVLAEVGLARSKGRRILPFWARGDNWHDCAPLELALTQYADGRGERYEQGLRELLATLSLAGDAPPPPPARTVPSYPTPRGGQPAGHLTPMPLYRVGLRGWIVNGAECILPPLCAVPEGVFTMGSDSARDPHTYGNETPQYPVTAGPFAINQYPVTVAEYACAVRAKAVREPPRREYHGTVVDWPSQLQRPDHPAVSVSWHDATAYARWLARVTHQAWRLPTEAEWEKAARGTDARIYPWGDAFDSARCNTSESGIGSTAPVGSYPNGASPYGAQDMAGNVREWTSSLYKPYPYRADDGREQPSASGPRVLRGGSYRTRAILARAAFRDRNEPEDIGGARGFRLIFAVADA